VSIELDSSGCIFRVEEHICMEEKEDRKNGKEKKNGTSIRAPQHIR
jgi:hypothetical protein